MKYIKKFNESYQDSVEISEEDFNTLKSLIKKDLDILGIGFESTTFENKQPVQYHPIKPITIKEPKNIKYYNMNFKFVFLGIENSILYLISKAIFETLIVFITPLSSKFLQPVQDTSIIFCKYDIRNDENILSTVNPVNAQEGYQVIIKELLKLVDTFSDRVCVGASSKWIYPIYKDIMKTYLTSLISKEDDTEVYEKIRNIFTKSNNNYELFNSIKKNNPYLYSKLNNLDTDIATNMADTGF